MGICLSPKVLPRVLSKIALFGAKTSVGVILCNLSSLEVHGPALLPSRIVLCSALAEPVRPAVWCGAVRVVEYVVCHDMAGFDPNLDLD